MTLQFLSDEWFRKVTELTDAASPLEIPPAMRDVVVNRTVETAGGSVEMCMNGGRLEKGRREVADVQMEMPAEYAFRILVAGDWAAGMKGYIARRTRLSGNMRKLIPLQVYRPTPSQTALREQILAITGPVPSHGEA